MDDPDTAGRRRQLRDWRRAQLASQWPRLLTAVAAGVALPITFGLPDLDRPFAGAGHEVDVTIVMIAAIGGLFLALAALTGRRLRELWLAGAAFGIGTVHPGLDFVFGTIGDHPAEIARSTLGAGAAVAAAWLARPRRTIGTANRDLAIAMAVTAVVLRATAGMTDADHLAPASILLLATALAVAGALALARGVSTSEGGLVAIGVLASSAGLGTTLQLLGGQAELTVGVATITMTSVILAAIAALMAFLAALERHDQAQDVQRLARSLEIARLTAETERHAEVAHDQRTSLLAIEAAARRLQDDPNGGLAAAVADEAARLHRIIEGATPGRGRFTVEHVVSPVVACLSALHGPIALRIDGSSAAWGDVDEAAEIVRAMIDNAHVHGLAPVSVDVATDGDAVVVGVRDSGRGVAPGLREVVFERGVTSEPTTHSGLGLYAARRLARAHGGDLGISESDAARFELTLPVRAPAPDAHAGIADRAEPAPLRVIHG